MLNMKSSANLLVRLSRKCIPSPVSMMCTSSLSLSSADGHGRRPARICEQKSIISLGQPTYESHPEFFNSSSEIIPGVTKEELKKRRTALCNMASELVKKKGRVESDLYHLMIIPASAKKYMSENIPYPYRQNSNFLYLSGSFDTEAFLALAITPTEQIHNIFLGKPDPVSDLWDGPKTSPNAAVNFYGFDAAYRSSEFDIFIRDLVHRSKKRLVIWSEDNSFVERYMNPLFNYEYRQAENPRGIIDVLRWIKSPAEIALMRKSSEIASKAFQETIKFTSDRIRQGKVLSEHQIWAKLDYETRLNGAERLAYPPVVASGDRANTIHYVFNTNKCNANDMVLVDAGCEFFGYCSDITRTWPVSGKFVDDRHRSLYEMLLDMQLQLIRLVEPGITLDQLFRIMGPLLVKGLKELGILSESAENLSADTITSRFCPHHVSHYLGMDVHDTPSVLRNELLQPGMIVTVEPGVYIRNSPGYNDLLSKVGKEFDGIAIRIEDDVVVTKDGNSVLTESCPKTIQEIEKFGSSI